MKINLEKFDSIETFLKVIETRPKNEVMKYANASHDGDKAFTGTQNFDEAMELLKNGYEKPLNKIKSEISKDLKISQSRPRRTPRNAVVGFVPNVPNYLLGVPEQMITINQTPQKVKAVSIIYYIGNNCGTSASSLEKAGITMLNVINRLELSGIRVNFDISAMCTQRIEKPLEEWQIVTINVKSYREQLDIKKLCFPLAHPSMFRRLGFAWLERSTDIKLNFSYSYGKSATSSDEKTLCENVFKGNEIFITQDHVSKMTADELLDFINKKHI